MSWLEEHIETFVKPTVGEFDETPLGYFEPGELTVIKNTWRAIKQNAKQNGKRQILLPGRDVFVFEILARRENYPTIFMPECSRMTVRELARRTPNKGLYLFDTGFLGSIPRNLKIDNFGLLSYTLRGEEGVGKQVFPRLTLSRGLALKIERTPKYWESGRVVHNAITDTEEVCQPLSHKEEFIRAARLTIEIYKNSAPKFISHHKPVPQQIEVWAW